MFQASQETYDAVRQVHDVSIVLVNVNGYRIRPVQSVAALPGRSARSIGHRLRDRQGRIARTLTFGTQTLATEDIPDWMWAFNPSLRNYPHDPAEARSLLRQAGWAPGPDGVMRKAGQRLSLVMVTNNSNVTRRRESLEVQAMLRQIGIDTELKSYPGDVLFAPAGMGGILQLGKFDLTVSGWYAGIDPDNSSQLMCENFPPSGYNYSRYCSPAMQAAQHIALTHYDRPTRVAAYYQTQALVDARYPRTLHLLPASNGADQRRFSRFRTQPRRRILERVGMEHLGLPDLTWLRKIIVERALTRGDYVLAGGARSDYYIDKFSLFSDPTVLRRIARFFTPIIADAESRSRCRN